MSQNTSTTQANTDVGMGHNNIVVFVASSDNTADVLRQVSPSWLQFWPDCPYPIYVGLNSPIPDLPPRFQPIYAPKAGWRDEVRAQIAQLPASISQIVLVLDDFLFLQPVDQARFARLAQQALSEQIPYLRLIPQLRAWVPRQIEALRRSLGKLPPYERIGQDMPYYSSLQIALWQKSHLLEMLALPGNIWDFENQRIPKIQHYAVYGESVIRYVHVVEKGKWGHYAPELFQQIGLPLEMGKRAQHSAGMHRTMWINRLKFEVYGYAWLRLKKRLIGRYF